MKPRISAILQYDSYHFITGATPNPDPFLWTISTLTSHLSDLISASFGYNTAGHAYHIGRHMRCRNRETEWQLMDGRQASSVQKSQAIHNI